MRGMERWGAKHMIAAMFTGFKALPNPEGKRPWYVVLNVAKDSNPDMILNAWRNAVKATHPDTGGDPSKFREVQTAMEDARKEMNF